MYLKKKELLEQLRGKVKSFKQEMDSAFGVDEYRFAKGKWFVASDLEHKIKSGAFDADESELQHLRAALEKITEQIDELLDEKAEWQVVADRGWHVAGEETKKNESLCDQLQSAQQEIERLGNLARQERELADYWMRKHHDDVVKLRVERDKLIAWLKYAHRFAKRDDLYDKDYVDEILKEIGVTVE